jgi:hypothetical protein
MTAGGGSGSSSSSEEDIKRLRTKREKKKIPHNFNGPYSLLLQLEPLLTAATTAAPH